MVWIAFWGALSAVGVLGLVVSVQGLRFERRVVADARALAALPPAAAAPPVPLDALPAPVQRYLDVSGAAGRPPIRGLRLRYAGTFAMKPGAPPLPIRGTEYFTADPPGFVWWGRVRLAPGVWVDGRDQSVGGEGNMLIRAASTLTIADARGPELDQGALHRLLVEALWMPTLLRDPRYVTWAPADGSAARATLRVGGREVTGEFRFGPDGLPARFGAERFFVEGDGKSVLTPWRGEMSDYREVGGVRVPFRVDVTWDLPTGPFTYVRWVIEEVELDRAEPW